MSLYQKTPEIIRIPIKTSVVFDMVRAECTTIWHQNPACLLSAWSAIIACLHAQCRQGIRHETADLLAISQILRTAGHEENL